jgi:hypothetical protein
MSDIDALQSAASRYSDVAGFGALTADGVMGPQTTNATLAALHWIVTNTSHVDDANAILGSASNQSQIGASAGYIAQFLNNVADDQNLGGSNLVFPDASSPQSAGTQIRVNPTGPATAPGAASLVNAWGGLPAPVKVVFGGLTVLGALWGLSKAFPKRKRSKAA